MAVKLQSVSCEKMQSVGPKSGRKNRILGLTDRIKIENRVWFWLNQQKWIDKPS